MFLVISTARHPNGMARLTRHQRPHVGAVGSVGHREGGGAHLVEGCGRDAGGPAPGEPNPKSPIQSRTARARPSQPAQLSRAPKAMKRAVAIICQTMFWNASSPAIHATVKLSTVKGSRRMGR